MMANAHAKLDAAVFAAYGWVPDGQPKADLTDEQILEKLPALNLDRAGSADTTDAKGRSQAKME
jgi:hypothetical protein